MDLYKPPAAERDRPALRRSCLELAQAGRNLYNLIFTSASQPKDMATTVRSWLGEVTGTDGVQSLEVISEGQPWFAPWNLVYDADPDEDLFLKADPRADGGVDLPAAALRRSGACATTFAAGCQSSPSGAGGCPARSMSCL